MSEIKVDPDHIRQVTELQDQLKQKQNEMATLLLQLERQKRRLHQELDAIQAEINQTCASLQKVYGVSHEHSLHIEEDGSGKFISKTDDD